MTALGRGIHGQERSRRARVSDLAAKQWGYIATWQMPALDVPDHAIDNWCRAEWLTPRYRMVYAVGHVQESRRADFMAAVLALGDGAVLSHISAGQLWGMVKIRQPWIDVTTQKKLKSRDDIHVHQSRGGFEATTRWGIPVKTPLETVIDLAECIRKDELLLRAINQGLADELYTWDSLNEQLKTARGRHGVKRIRRLIHLVTPTRSGLEDEAFKAAVARGARPLTNHIIEGLEVDQYDPITNTAIEIDSAKYHGNPIAKYLDGLKQGRLEALGLPVNRLTEDDVG